MTLLLRNLGNFCISFEIKFIFVWIKILISLWIMMSSYVKISLLFHQTRQHFDRKSSKKMWKNRSKWTASNDYPVKIQVKSKWNKCTKIKRRNKSPKARAYCLKYCLTRRMYRKSACKRRIERKHKIRIISRKNHEKPRLIKRAQQLLLL